MKKVMHGDRITAVIHTEKERESAEPETLIEPFLTRFVGKSKAMEMCLTARMMDAAEAERAGLVSRIVPLDQLVDEAVKTAQKIAELSRPVVMMAKECVNRSYETTLSEGVRFERRVFHSTFAVEDQKEGMKAFVEKRKPAFQHR